MWDPEKKHKETPVNIVNSWLDLASQPHLKQNIQPQRQVILSPQFVGSKSSDQVSQVQRERRAISHPTMLLEGLILFEQTSQQGVAALNLRSLAISQNHHRYKKSNVRRSTNLRKSQEATSEKAITLAVLSSDMSQFFQNLPWSLSIFVTLLLHEKPQNDPLAILFQVPRGISATYSEAAWDSWSACFCIIMWHRGHCRMPQRSSACHEMSGGWREYQVFQVPSHLGCNLGFDQTQYGPSSWSSSKCMISYHNTLIHLGSSVVSNPKLNSIAWSGLLRTWRCGRGGCSSPPAATECNKLVLSLGTTIITCALFNLVHLFFSDPETAIFSSTFRVDCPETMANRNLVGNLTSACRKKPMASTEHRWLVFCFLYPLGFGTVHVAYHLHCF